MKSYFLLLSLFIRTFLSAAQTPASNEFLLSGEIKDCPKKKIYLGYTDKSGNRKLDSCLLQNGRFTFKGNISEPTFAFIRTNSERMPDDENKNIASLFLEPGNMIAKFVHDHFNEMELTGSKSHDEYTLLSKKRRFINENHKDSLYERHSKLTEEFILDHGNSYISAHALAFYRGRWPMSAVQFLYSRFDSTIQNSSYGREIKEYMDGQDANSAGRKAKDFVAKEMQGKTIKLSDLKGKYVLLDFWGSWCVPCRESNPHLIELHKKYAEKGFAIVGVATEYEKTDTKWREAIKKDGTGIWYNVLSTPMPGTPGQFTKEIHHKFGVHSFPTKILIDPCGYIIGRFNGTEEDVKLDERLKEVFN
jgi:thiol-disulfide isomerase/thioredoxin